MKGSYKNEGKEVTKGRLSKWGILGDNSVLLEAYLKLDEITTFIDFSPKYKKQLAITIAQEKGCPDCLSYHICIGKSIGLSEEEVSLNTKGVSLDLKTNAGLKFVQELVRTNGVPSEQIIEEFKLTGGYNDEDVMKTILVVIVNILYMDELCESFCT